MALLCVDIASARGGKKWKETLHWCEKVPRNPQALSLWKSKFSEVKAVFHMLKVFHVGADHVEARLVLLPMPISVIFAALKSEKNG